MHLQRPICKICKTLSGNTINTKNEICKREIVPGNSPGAVFFGTESELQCASDCTAAAHIHGKPKILQSNVQTPISSKSQCKPLPFTKQRSLRESNNLQQF